MGRHGRFFWTPLLDEIGVLLGNKRTQHLLVTSRKGLIAYGVGEEEDCRNISDDDEKFATKSSAEGVPDAICDLLFQKYVIEATVTEAVEKHVLVADIEALIREGKYELDPQAVFLVLVGLIKLRGRHPGITEKYQWQQKRILKIVVSRLSSVRD